MLPMMIVDRTGGPLAALALAAVPCLLAACATPAATPPMAHHHHTIDYIELSVLDLAEAKRFYTAAFGWSFQDYGPDYAGIQKPGGGESGGMIQVPSVQRGGPLVVLYSEDLDASVEAVRAAGGRIVQDPFPFPGGRRFHFLDPSGNELAVWAAE